MAQGNYEGISIRAAMEKINAKTNGWFLPNIQRQYVWGCRDSSEEYICLLVDSLMRGFPIGGLVLWETDEKVAYREFLGDYAVGSVAKIVPEERWGNNKFLVYDGQQRLQTLHSVLYHRFNGRVLYFNLLFDAKNADIDETGFYFKNANEIADAYSIAMPELTGKNTTEEKIALRRRLTRDTHLTEDELSLIETNFERLWAVFVDEELRSIAYFPVKSKNATAVNEVFRRLNTGGVPLTQLEMVLAKIKEKAPYFEEALCELTRKVREATGSPGYEFTAAEIVQLMYVLIFRTTRVDESRVEASQVSAFIEMLPHVEKVLPVFFKHFFYEGFHINAKWLVPRQQAVLPMLAYCVELERNGFHWEPQKLDMTAVRTYFIKSQLCDWNTQTMVTAFAKLSMDCAAQGKAFPIEEITQIAVGKNRTGDVYFYQLEGAVWFSLKILTPDRMYLFDDRTPQIDHIFPMALHAGQIDDVAYRTRVNVLWNMQPTPAELNNYKRAKPPVEFFKSAEGSPYLSSYDFLPDIDGEEFGDEIRFVGYRKNEMIQFIKSKYDIDLMANPC